VIVLGLPMYNFGVPSTLKAYFDHVAGAGVTFRYTERESVGLLTGKKAYIFAARGGNYVGTPLYTQTPCTSSASPRWSLSTPKGSPLVTRAKRRLWRTPKWLLNDWRKST
jgi:multimeric flavodoxin WrbA